MSDLNFRFELSAIKVWHNYSMQLFVVVCIHTHEAFPADMSDVSTDSVTVSLRLRVPLSRDTHTSTVAPSSTVYDTGSKPIPIAVLRNDTL